MPTALSALLWLLIAINALALLYWGIVAFRVQRVVRNRPTVRAGLDLALPPDEKCPTVSVVVPVHNEERVIDECCASLRRQAYPALELIFVLDRCTDGTHEILARHAAEDDRVVLVENDSCPADWAGKCHAAHRGAARATGAFLLFTDADTAFDVGLVRASLAIAETRGIDLLSLLSTLTYDRMYECVAQPVASMHLVRMYPMERVNRADNARPFANGQFMLFRRDAYETIGGHEAVKDDLLEDIAFARLVHKAGRCCDVLLADGMLICSMYDTLAAFKEGWKRIFIEACKRKPDRLRKNAARILWIGLAMPLLQIAALTIGIAASVAGSPVLGVGAAVTVAIAWAVQLAVLARTNAIAGAPVISALLFPAGCWIVARVMLDGARDLVERKPIRWAGKTYTLEPR